VGDLSQNFSRNEWECFCGCGFDTVDFKLIKVLEDLRDNFGGIPLIITDEGGCRCPAQNLLSGGSKRSKHMLGRAADIKIKNIPPTLVHRYLVNTYPGELGIGLYKTFVHVDTRSDGPARWGDVNGLLS